ncbi:MAG: ATP-binding protein [Chloroflexi bacterium]|nr:ATP-binding protein [Chloroflexota bacterium]
MTIGCDGTNGSQQCHHGPRIVPPNKATIVAQRGGEVEKRVQSWLSPALVDEGSRANLEDLRQQLVARLVPLLIGSGGFVAWAILPIRPLPLALFSLALALVALGGVAWSLNGRHTRLARHVLVWGMTLLLLAAIRVFDAPWLPFLGLLVTFANAFLIGSSGVLAASAVAALTIWLSTGDPARSYALHAVLMALAVGVALSWLVINTLYTALQWARTMQRRADELLMEAQDKQAELKRTLKSLELANYQIERSNQELLIAREHADEARRMKEQFAANISHELRTPLNLILGFSELMYFSPQVYGDVPWPATLRRDVYQIHRSSVHLLEMIDDILDLSRFEITGFTLNKEMVDLEMLLRNTAEIAVGLLRGRPIDLTLAIEPNLPALDIDQTRIRQVVLNLLSNALRFTTQGTIRLVARRKEDDVVVSVADTGSGIPADKLSHIFDEFYQVDGSLRRSHEGAGLGLAICKRFVQAHDGRIWVESELGAGSTFHVALPIPGIHPPIVPTRLVSPLKPTVSKERPHVLVVDPDPAVASMIGRHVEGYDIVHVEDERHLCDDVRLQSTQAVVRNVPPAGLHGANASNWPPIPRVPVIECSLPSQSWIADDLSVAACLTKPVTTQRLLHEINRLGDIRDVLIVDDDQGFAVLIERMLAASGHRFEVRRAYDGQQGLQAMHERTPDLVLTDLAMPVMDGAEMLSRMRRTEALAHVPVILLTVTSYAEDVLRHHAGRIVVERAGGLQTLDVLHCLQALFGTLEPRRDGPGRMALHQSQAAQRVQNVAGPDWFE